MRFVCVQRHGIDTALSLADTIDLPSLPNPGELAALHAAVFDESAQPDALFGMTEVRAFDRIVEAGYLDTWRLKEPDTTDRYTWWAMRMRARERNVGWRLDYFFVDEAGFRAEVDAGAMLEHAEVFGNLYGTHRDQVDGLLASADAVS